MNIVGVKKKRFRIKPRSVITAVLAVAVVVLVWTQRSVVVQVFDAMRRGALLPLVMAGIFEFGRIVMHAEAFTRSFAVIGTKVPLAATVPAWFKMIFMNTVLPSGGTSGMAAVIDTARKRGVATGSATSATVFVQTCYYTAMFVIVLIGFAVMHSSGTLQVRNVLVGSVIGVAALAFISLLALGHLKPSLLQTLMRALERTVVRVCKKLKLKKTPAPWADALVHSFSSAATIFFRNPKKSLRVLLSMVVAMTLDLLAFVASGFAFGVTQPDALFGGYVTALVFNSFTVTPGGVGVVEGLASASLVSYGYPSTIGISVVLTYRAFMYWFPFVIGAIMMRLTGAFGSDEQTAAEGAGAAASPGASAGVGVAAGMGAGVGGTLEAIGAAVAGHGSGTSAKKTPGEEEPVYLHRRKPKGTLRQRFLAYAARRVDLRTIAVSLAAAAASICGMVAAALPPDAFLTELLCSTILPAGPIAPVPIVVFAYLAMLCLPGVAIRDQGAWLLTIVCTLGLGATAVLSAHGVVTSLLCVLALALAVVYHECFNEHGYLDSVPRLAGILLYAVVLAVLYATAGSLLMGGFITPEPTTAESLVFGLESLVAWPDFSGFELTASATGFFMSVRAVTIVLTVALAFVIAFLAVRYVIAANQPERKAEREESRRKTQEAADERRDRRRAKMREARDRKVEQVKTQAEQVKNQVQKTAKDNPLVNGPVGDGARAVVQTMGQAAAETREIARDARDSLPDRLASLRRGYGVLSGATSDDQKDQIDREYDFRLRAAAAGYGVFRKNIPDGDLACDPAAETDSVTNADADAADANPGANADADAADATGTSGKLGRLGRRIYGFFKGYGLFGKLPDDLLGQADAPGAADAREDVREDAREDAHDDVRDDAREDDRKDDRDDACESQ